MDRWTAAIAIAHLRLRLDVLCRHPDLLARLNSESDMPGEIRTKMAALRKAKEAMVVAMEQEIDGVIKEVAATHADGLEAMKLPRAELEATRQEIREIRAEFAPASNGGPAGPLPGTPGPSPEPSAAPAPAPEALQEPQASWKAAT